VQEAGWKTGGDRPVELRELGVDCLAWALEFLATLGDLPAREGKVQPGVAFYLFDSPAALDPELACGWSTSAEGPDLLAEAPGQLDGSEDIGPHQQDFLQSLMYTRRVSWSVLCTAAGWFKHEGKPLAMCRRAWDWCVALLNQLPEPNGKNDQWNVQNPYDRFAAMEAIDLVPEVPAGFTFPEPVAPALHRFLAPSGGPEKLVALMQAKRVGWRWLRAVAGWPTTARIYHLDQYSAAGEWAQRLLLALPDPYHDADAEDRAAAGAERQRAAAQAGFRERLKSASALRKRA
jgi:hypothetical protein